MPCWLALHTAGGHAASALCSLRPVARGGEPLGCGLPKQSLNAGASGLGPMGAGVGGWAGTSLIPPCTSSVTPLNAVRKPVRTSGFIYCPRNCSVAKAGLAATRKEAPVQ